MSPVQARCRRRRDFSDVLSPNFRRPNSSESKRSGQFFAGCEGEAGGVRVVRALFLRVVRRGLLFVVGVARELQTARKGGDHPKPFGKCSGDTFFEGVVDGGPIGFHDVLRSVVRSFVKRRVPTFGTPRSQSGSECKHTNPGPRRWGRGRTNTSFDFPTHYRKSPRGCCRRTSARQR